MGVRDHLLCFAGTARQCVAQEVGLVLALHRRDGLCLGDRQGCDRGGAFEDVYVLTGELTPGREGHEPAMVQRPRHDPHHGPAGTHVVVLPGPGCPRSDRLGLDEEPP